MKDIVPDPVRNKENGIGSHLDIHLFISFIYADPRYDYNGLDHVVFI